jgi:hypothetical protein
MWELLGPKLLAILKLELITLATLALIVAAYQLTGYDWIMLLTALAMIVLLALLGLHVVRI